MDPLLIDEWLGDSEAISMIDEASVALVRQRVRAEGKLLGLRETVTGKLVNIASELGHNQLAHAWGGKILIRPLRRAGIPGLEVVAADEGAGISAPSQALVGSPRIPQTSDPSAKASLGIGLAAVLELSDEVDFDVRMGAGTCVWARNFAESVPRRRQIGMYARPYPGEKVNGDHGAFLRADDALLIGVADGLGHGPEAREASVLAAATLRAHGSLALEQLLERCHEALRPTRGAVMAVARIHETTGELETACVGNVSVHLYGPQIARRFAGTSFVLGGPGGLRRLAPEQHPLGPRDVLVLFSDGLSTRVDLDGELDLLREHPIIIAHQLVERFGRNNDDVLVVVAR